MKKWVYLFLLIFLAGLVSAELEISKEAVNDIVISELGNSALFNINIKNLGATDLFKLYTLISGVDIEAEETIIEKNEEKTISVKVNFDKTILKNKDSFAFEYRIVGDKGGVTKDMLTARVYNFDKALSIKVDDIQVNQKEAQVIITNNINFSFPEITFNISSEFFDKNIIIPLMPYEEKVMNIDIDQDKLDKAAGGMYILTIGMESNESQSRTTSVFNLEETTSLKKDEGGRGIFFRTFTSKQVNEGNSKVIARASVTKDWFSKILTSTNIDPTDIKKEGIYTTLVFEKELLPGETFEVRVTTNYFIPVISIIIVIVAVWLYYVYVNRNLIMKKRIAFVKTKRGEFALKVMLNVKALRFVEKITILDTIPKMVKLYSKFGVVQPDRIDEINRRLEWDIESLNENEERIISYVIYTKLSIFGRFELPEAAVVYEKDGKIYETESNRVVAYYEQQE